MSLIPTSMKAFISVSFLLTSSYAYAASSEEVAGRLTELYSAQSGAEITWDSLKDTSDGFVMVSPAVKVAGQKETFEIGDLVFEGVSEAGDGTYLVEQVTMDGYSGNNEGYEITTSPFVMDGLELPPVGAQGAFGDLIMYRSAKLDEVSVAKDGKPVFKGNNFYATVDYDKTTTEPMKFEAALDKIYANLSGVPDPNAQEMIAALGFEEVNGRLFMTGSWDSASGRMIVDEYSLDMDEAGKLSFALSIDGFTQKFIQDLNVINKKNASEDASIEEIQAGLQETQLLMLGLVFNNASIRFDDASLTNKVLELIATQQGTTADALKTQVQFMVPAMLAQLQSPDLARDASAAMNAYFADPQSLQINVEPSVAQSFASLAGLAAGGPAAVISKLGVSIVANQ